MNIFSAAMTTTGTRTTGGFRGTNKFALVFLCGALAAAGFGGCSKKEEKQSGTSALSTKAAEQVQEVKGLTAQIPENSIGYLSWDLTSPAYQKLKNSPYQGRTGSSIETALASIEEKSALVRVLDKVFEIKKIAASGQAPDSSQGVLSKGVGFLVPPPPGEMEPTLGMIFESNAGSLDAKAAALKDALKAEKIPVSDLALGDGQGFSFKIDLGEVENVNLPMGVGGPAALLGEQGSAPAGAPAANKTVDCYFAWKGTRGVLSSNERLAGTLVTERPAKAPAITTTALFAKATSGLGQAADQLTTGYIDLEEAERAVPIAGAALASAAGAEAGAAGTSGAAAAPAGPGESPVRAVAWSILMTDSPENRANIVLNSANLKYKPWIAALSNSQSSSVAAALPSNPLLVLSLDGKTISSIKGLALGTALESAGPEERKMVEQQLAFMNDIVRLGLAVRMGPLGQSLIPAPDLLILAESSNPEGTKTQLLQIAATGMATSGLPAAWQEKTVQGEPVKYMLTPFGLGVFVSSVKNVVVISSTEAQLDGAIASIKSGKPAGAGGLTARASSAVSGEPTIASMYLNFNEVGSMVETMGGMMQMYAPQGGENGQILDQAQIQNLKQMGTFVGSMSIADGSVVTLRSFYDPAPQAAAASKG